MSPSSAATVALRLILCPNLCVLCPNVCVVVLVPESGAASIQHCSLGPTRPYHPLCRGRSVGFARSFPRSPVSKLVPDEREAYRPGCRNPTKTRALSRAFPPGIRTFPDLQEGFLAATRFITHSDGPGRADGCGVRCGCRPPRRGDRHGDRPGCVSLWWPVGGGPRPGAGRLAQRESASFTPRRSLVRSQYRPPAHRPVPIPGTGPFNLPAAANGSNHRQAASCSLSLRSASTVASDGASV